jgi:hypothetical protein
VVEEVVAAKAAEEGEEDETDAEEGEGETDAGNRRV